MLHVILNSKKRCIMDIMSDKVLYPLEIWSCWFVISYDLEMNRWPIRTHFGLCTQCWPEIEYCLWVLCLQGQWPRYWVSIELSLWSAGVKEGYQTWINALCPFTGQVQINDVNRFKHLKTRKTRTDWWITLTWVTWQKCWTGEGDEGGS